MIDREPVAPFVMFDDDDILSLHRSFADLCSSVEESFIDEITGVYDGAGNSYDLAYAEETGFYLVREPSHTPLVMRVKQFVAEWTFLDAERTPEEFNEIVSFLESEALVSRMRKFRQAF